MAVIRVAHVADTHADEHSRFDEHERVMRFISDRIRDSEIDLVVHAGDIFERATTTAREREAVSDWVQAVAESAPLVLVRGNHDSDLDVLALNRLRTDHNVFTFDRPSTITLAGCEVHCLPWPRRSALVAAITPDVPREQVNAMARDALASVLRGFSAGAAHAGWPRIFVGHVDLDGAVTDTDQPMVNGDMSVSLSELALAGADYYALGHIHRHQRAAIDGAPVVYPGSPRHCNWGEPTAGKGFVVASFDRVEGRWRCVDVEHVETPCRPMLLWDDVWGVDKDGAGGFTRTMGWAVRGAEVRFRYRVQADRREAAKAAARQLEQQLREEGAVDVKLEEQVIATSKARVPEIATKASVFEQLEAKWAADGVALTPERRARLREKLADLEAMP